VYVSLAPGMENPAGKDPPEDDAARCARYTSSEEEQARPIPTTEERVAGKRPLAADPSPAPTLPAESSQAPKRRRLVQITTTTTRRRMPHRRWSEGLVAVRTMRRPLLIRWPATLMRRASQKRGHRRRPAGLGGGSPRPTVHRTCKCSTYVLWRFFLLLLKMLLFCSARRRTSTPTKSQSRGRPSLLPLLRTLRHRPQTSLRRRPLLQAPRDNLPRRVPPRALRRGMGRQQGPLPQVQLQRRRAESRRLQPKMGGSRHRPWAPLA